MTRPSAARRALGHVVLPVAAGAACYLLWRSPRLLVFRLVDALGLHAMVEAARRIAAPVRPLLPEPALFSLPDALWVYAFTAALALVWRGERGAAGPLCVAFAPAVALGSEAGQGMGLVPGTFDWADAAFSAAAAALAVLIVYRNRRTDLS